MSHSSDHSLLLNRTFQYLGIILVMAALGGGYWYWKQAKAAQTVNDNRPSFEAPLTHDLNLSAGQGIAAYSRADGADRRATVTDFEGLIRPVKQNEARFEGARRVENLFSYSNDFSNAAWTVQLGATKIGTNQMSLTSTSGSGFYQQMAAVMPDNNGRTFRYSIDVQWVSGDTSYVMGGYSDVGFAVNPNTTIAVSSEWKRFSILATTHASTDATNLSFNLIRGTNGGVINVRNAQIEEVTGQANQNPSEYVSTNVKTSFPYHGAGVDRVKYFDTQNGNTVASNVVTEATGAALPATTIRGYLAEGARTNLVLQSDNIGTTWSKENLILTSYTDVTASPDGRSTADKMIEDTSNAQHRIYQYVTHTASTSITGSIYVKAAGRNHASVFLYNPTNSVVAGAVIDLTNGTLSNIVGTVSAVSAGNGWYRVQATGTPTVTSTGLHIYTANGTGSVTPSYAGDGTSGVYVWGAQLEQAAFASSYIPTTTATVVRMTDSLSYPSSNLVVLNPYTLALDAAIAIGSPSGAAQQTAIGSNVNYAPYLMISNGAASANSYFYSGTANTSSIANSDTNKLAMNRYGARMDGTNINIFLNGSKGNTIAKGTQTSEISSLYIGRTSGGSHLYGTVKNVRIWKKALSDTELQSLTSTTEGIATSAVKKTTIANAPNNTGLVGYWSFEDGSGTKAEDFSPTGTNTGILTNGPMWVDGKIGKALSFVSASSQHLLMGGSSQLKNSVFTYSAWINPANLGTMTIFGGGTVDTPRFRITSGSPALVDTGILVLGTASSSVTANRWTHVAVTYDALGNFMFYIDGIVNGSGTDLRTFDFSSAAFEVGRNGQANNEYFNGQIDEVRIYDYALSASEVADLYSQGSVGKTTVNASQNTQLTSGLVGLWSFNGPDVSGTTAYDRSGQGNNGTLTGGPTVYPGKVGQGLKFDGTSSYVSVPHAAIFEPGGSQWAVSAWVRASSDGTILCKSANEPSACDFNADHYGLRVVSGKASFSFSNGDFINIATGTSSVTDGDWHFIVGTRSASKTADIYVDGAFEATFTGTGVNGGIEVSVPLYIGSDDAAVSDGLGGYIDEVRIYNRALSTAEISALYQMGK